MFPIDLELFKTLIPIVLVAWGLILFFWSRVEHPLRTIQLESTGDKAFERVRELIHGKGFLKLEEDETAKRIRIKGMLKIVDLILYRCWSKEIIFHVIDENSRAKLSVTCKPSPLRITASPSNPYYLTYDGLDRFLQEIVASLKT